MRAARRLRWIAVAALLHALLLVSIRPRSAVRAVATITPLSWVTRSRPIAPVQEPASARAPAAVLDSAHAPQRQRIRQLDAEPPPPGTTPADGAQGPIARPERGPVDLFAPSALGAIVAPPDWGGHTRRSVDGSAGSNNEGAAVDEDKRLNDRVGRWLSEAGSEGRVRSGAISPHWRDLERQVDARFRPTISQITDQSAAGMLAHQYRRGLATDPTSDPTVGARPPTAAGGLSHWEEVLQQIRDCQRRFDEPGDWQRIEIEVILDGYGRLVEARVVAASGRRALDAAALEAVRRAADGQLLANLRTATVARFVVEAGVSVESPRISPTFDPVTGKPDGGLLVGLPGLRFDESTGKIGLQHVLKRTVHTRVTLKSVSPAP